MLRKCGTQQLGPSFRGSWLSPGNVLSTLAWSQSRGLPGLRVRAAEYAAAHLSEVALTESPDTEDNLSLVLRLARKRKAEGLQGSRDFSALGGASPLKQLTCAEG